MKLIDKDKLIEKIKQDPNFQYIAQYRIIELIQEQEEIDMKTSYTVSPCKGCKDREEGCHQRCQRYRRWKQYHALIKYLKRAEEREETIRGGKR